MEQHRSIGISGYGRNLRQLSSFTWQTRITGLELKLTHTHTLADKNNWSRIEITHTHTHKSLYTSFDELSELVVCLVTKMEMKQ